MNQKIYTEERRNGILQLLKQEGSVSVADLSERYNVSGTTIRIDLNALEEQGLLQRTHGGAVVLSDLTKLIREPKISERSRYEEKRRIANAALPLISKGDTILIDTGTTMTCLAEVLASSFAENLTVYSNDLSVLQILENRENLSLRILGGSIRCGFHYTYGQQVLEELNRYHFRKLFLASSAVNQSGLSTSNSDLAAVKRAMIHCSDEVIVLADSSKLGLQDFETFADLSEISVFITDNSLSEKERDYLEEKIPSLIIA